MKAILYDAAGKDGETEVTAHVLADLGKGRLLWIDIDDRSDAHIDAIGEALALTSASIALLKGDRASARVDNFGAYLQFSVLTVPSASDHKAAEPDLPSGPKPAVEAARRLDFVISEHFVVTVHDRGLGFLRAFHDQDKGETKIGALSGHILAASLLDWHLETFFHEVGRVEGVVDQIDERVLSEPRGEALLSRMLFVRRHISGLRRLLVAQRNVFYGLGRPDLLEGRKGEQANAHYHALANRYERAIDEVEHTRELLLGSFELFSSRTSSDTNDLVKSLTFLTVVIGGVAAIAGLFGMNFDPPFFSTGAAGFFAVTGSLTLLAVIFWFVARRKRWI